jgi:hypothetical protein
VESSTHPELGGPFSSQSDHSLRRLIEREFPVLGSARSGREFCSSVLLYMATPAPPIPLDDGVPPAATAVPDVKGKAKESDKILAACSGAAITSLTSKYLLPLFRYFSLGPEEVPFTCATLDCMARSGAKVVARD